MSSTILSRPIEVGRYGLIYASAQKNIGPAGLCVVIVREDLLERAATRAPAVLELRADGRRRLDAQHAADPQPGTSPGWSSNG